MFVTDINNRFSHNHRQCGVCGFFHVFFCFLVGEVSVFSSLFYAFHLITTQLCRKYALLSNINSILFVYGFPTVTHVYRKVVSFDCCISLWFIPRTPTRIN